MAEVRALMIGLILFSGVLLGMSGFYTDITHPDKLTSYGYNAGQIANITPQDLSDRNVTQQITTQTESIKTTLEQQPTGIGAVDVAWGYINAALQAIQLPFTAISVFTNMLNDVSIFLGVPFWVTGIVMGIILIIIVFEVLSGYMKWRF